MRGWFCETYWDEPWQFTPVAEEDVILEDAWDGSEIDPGAGCERLALESLACPERPRN